MHEKSTTLLNTTAQEFEEILSDKRPIQKIHGLPAYEYRRLIRERDRNTNPNYIPSVAELNHLQREEKAQRKALTVREWNRLQQEKPIIITDDKQINAHVTLVFDAKSAWKYMNDPRYVCISIKATYKGRHAYLFRLQIKDELPW
ncbi:MAG: hypothetical protein IJ418_05905 [Clostridia bacterium]|nr:hypothetical protein [Clostridia bacterium]